MKQQWHIDIYIYIKQRKKNSYLLILCGLRLGRGRAACNERKRGINPHLVVILVAMFVAANY